MGDRMKLAAGFITGFGIVIVAALIIIGVGKAATVKIDRQYTSTFQSTWNKYEPAQYKLLKVACWKGSDSTVHNCIIERAALSNKSAPVCGEIGVDTSYAKTKAGVEDAIEGFTPYTCKSITPAIKAYLAQGGFTA